GDAEKRGKLRLVASRAGRDGSVTICRDLDLYATLLGEGDAVRHDVKPGRAAWVQVAEGAVSLDGRRLDAGDGAAIETAGAIEIKGAAETAEVLLFDLAA
ncbi:MAG: pirin family protein, partial [Methylocystis sp.]|nr:pirin family protein [Methylocystis sp.]